MRLSAAFIAASSLALAACADNEPVTADDANLTVNEAVLDNAVAVGNDAAPPPGPAMSFVGGDGSAFGSVTVEDGPGGLLVRLAGTSMPPGVHGIHIHMAGRCEGPAFESAGAHWNPASKKHGRDNAQGAHLGDLANIEIGADGSATTTLGAPGVMMTSGANIIADADGTSIVVHAKADDYKTDPSGDSGDRIACAVLAPPK